MNSYLFYIILHDKVLANLRNYMHLEVIQTYILKGAHPVVHNDFARTPLLNAPVNRNSSQVGTILEGLAFCSVSKKCLTDRKSVD